MDYKDILVFIDDGASNIERVKAVFQLAKDFNARLTGVTLAALTPEHLKTKDGKALVRMSEQAAEKRMDEFLQMAEQAGIDASMRIMHGDQSTASKKMAQYSRNFDLVVLRQANPQKKNFDMLEEVAEKVILLSGRPVFFMPYIGAHRIPCQRAMIAWDGTPAATRTVHDAIPMLKDLEKVMILVVREGKNKTAKGELLVNDLVDHLSRHGVNAEVNRTSSGTFDVPTVILNVIAENDMDLLIMGGYGTPSLKQKIFGGVTRTLLSTMLTPVFMSH